MEERNRKRKKERGQKAKKMGRKQERMKEGKEERKGKKEKKIEREVGRKREGKGEREKFVIIAIKTIRRKFHRTIFLLRFTICQLKNDNHLQLLKNNKELRLCITANLIWISIS